MPALRKAVVAAVCVALLFVPTSLAASPVPRSPMHAARGATYARQALAAINEARRGRALRALRFHLGLARSAAGHVRRMAQDGYFGHSGVDEGPVAARIHRYYRGSIVGEVIAWSQSDLAPERAVAAWLASRVHRSVLLDRRFRHVGIAVFRVSNAPGVYSGRDATIVVADFGAP